MRPKLIKGQLYHIKGYTVGRGGVPLKTYHEYIVKYLQRDKSSITTSGQQIQILATNKVWEDNQSYIGISLSDYNGRTQYFEPRSKQHRIIYIGNNRAEDCMSIKEFDMENLPLCMGWPYCAEELTIYLKVA